MARSSSVQVNASGDLLQELQTAADRSLLEAHLMAASGRRTRLLQLIRCKGGVPGRSELTGSFDLVSRDASKSRQQKSHCDGRPAYVQLVQAWILKHGVLYATRSEPRKSICKASSNF